MFSIFHGLFTLFAMEKNRISKSLEDDNNRVAAKQKGELTYFGSRGGEYLVENGRQVCHVTRFGHDLLVDMYDNSKVYHDYTEEKEKKYKERALQHAFYHNERTYHGNTLGIIKWFPTNKFDIDIETNKIVSYITVNNSIFFLDMETGLIIKPINNNKEYEDNIGIYTENNIPLNSEQIIEIFNKRQYELQKHPAYNNDSLWMRLYYYMFRSSYLCPNVIMDCRGKILKNKYYYTDAELDKRNEGL